MFVAVESLRSHTVTVVNSTVANNAGRGVFFMQPRDTPVNLGTCFQYRNWTRGSTVAIVGSVIANNTVRGVGAGVAVVGGGAFTIAGTQVSGNLAGAVGGGVYMDSSTAAFSLIGDSSGEYVRAVTLTNHPVTITITPSPSPSPSLSPSPSRMACCSVR